MALFIYCPLPGAAQNYGLGFASHEVIADQRTMLNLFPKEEYHVQQNFQLSFEMSFLANKSDYFGYICRIITGKHNIDLVFNNRYVLAGHTGRNRFRLVIGDHYANIDFAIPPDKLFNRWNKVALRFNCGDKVLSLYVNDRKVGQEITNFLTVGDYKMIFGICDEPQFKTIDCSAIKLRNVKIQEGTKVRYYWPLNESDGKKAHEEISGQSASVTNPLWVMADHAKWRLEKKMHVNGVASMAFDSLKDQLYVVGSDSLYKISLGSYSAQAVGYQGAFDLLPGNESVFIPTTRHLYNYYIDNAHQQLAIFDTVVKRWSTNPAFTPIRDYQQTNSFFCAADSSIYVVGGYGRMTYKNEVFRCALTSGKWEKILTKGDFFCPRYLSACATTNGGSIAYFLGGYGSVTGEQMLNAKNLYDLTRFDVKTRSFKKIFELKAPNGGFVCSNTMIINEQAKTYAVLIYSNQKFNAEFRLLTGSLSNPSYQLLGDPIPFNFYDTHSFVKLFYSKANKQYVAVTMYRPADHDHDSYFQILTLMSPAETLHRQTLAVSSPSSIKFYILFALIALGGTGYYFYYHKTRDKEKVINIPEPVLQIDDILEDHTQGAAIFLFGNMKISDQTGKDLTGNFTSLVKELFLVIIIYSLRSNGITPDKLIELLWKDKSDESARNNRSANLSKLKSVLSQMDYIHLSKDTGSWRTEIDYSKLHVDFYEFQQIVGIKKRLSKEEIAKLCKITSRGGFLATVEYYWLDQIKSDIANEAIDIYLKYIAKIKIEDEPDFAIEVANAIFNFDAVNEEAMMVKCKALAILGKHSLAKSAYESFKREFKELYGEEFKADFNAVVSA